MITKYVEKLKEELVVRNCSRKTILTYIIGLQTFWRFFRKPLHLANQNNFREFKLHLLNKKKEPKTINTYLAGVKFFYKNILKRKINLQTVKEKEKIVRILTKSEIDTMILKTYNIKHKLLIMFMYFFGLRVSEAVKLKYSDLDLENKACYVRQGKGRKDRITILSYSFVGLLKQYILNDDINEFYTDYIFPGRKSYLSIRSAEEVVKQAAKRIGRHAYPHLLRQSFATHLLDNRVDARKIQKAMGHTNLETMYNYTKSSKPLIKSPMDL